jgi:serine/threonine protein kinase
MLESETLLNDRYSIVHIEHTGSFSKVFFALDTYQNPPRSCLIKVFEPIIQKDQIAQWIEKEFNKELKHLKQLSLFNKHLPEIYTYSSEFQIYYIVRELVEGETLREKVKTKGEFPPNKVRKILAKLLLILKYLHQEGVIHQNIKPKNVILRNDDHIPMLINFGSIKQIVSTYGFYGDKKIFSVSNIHGYAPSEQALGKSVPASDLYSLGLTAIYLLTAKNPVDLAVDSDSGNFQLPHKVFAQDPNLAAIITRSISSNLGDRYNSAAEMLDDLLCKKSNPSGYKLPEKQVNPVIVQKEINLDRPKNYQSINRRQINWWKTAIYTITGLYILGAGILALYDWNLSRNAEVHSLPKPKALSSAAPPKSSTVDQSVPPLMLNSPPDDVIEIPILATGSTKAEVRETLGEPSAIQKGYWANSTAWIYQKQASDSIDLGYLFDLDTNQLQQTEVAIAPAVGLPTIQDILDSLLQGGTTPLIDQELQKIYNRQATKHVFKLGDLEGSIAREADGHIYLGVWEANFH